LRELIRLVPKPGVGRAEIEQLAERSGWLHFRSIEGGEYIPFEGTWVTPDGGAAIHWIEDEANGVHYLAVEGPDPEPALDVLRSELDLYDDASLAELFDRTRDAVALMEALRILGVHNWGPFDPDHFALFRWAMHDPEPLVRRVALTSAANTRWPEIEPLLEHLREHDPVPSVRDRAATMLAALRVANEGSES